MTDTRVVERAGFVEQARAALGAGGGGCALQLRAHGLSGRRFWELAGELSRAAAEAGAQLWVNDRVDVGLALRLPGIQLGSRSLPPEAVRGVVGSACLLGCSTHSADEAASVLAVGADLAVLGHVYETASHAERPALGLGAVERASASGRPIVAIGGITPKRVPELLDAGAWGVATLSGVWDAPDIPRAVGRYLSAFEGAVAPRTSEGW